MTVLLAHLHIVRNLNQVIKLYSFSDDGSAHRRAVNGGVGANLYIVFYNDHVADLGNLSIGAIRLWGKAKSIGANRLHRNVT